eukprot:Nitzschia sp. Nitz4//scaffold49_size126201//91731//92603//NITZ4_003654-RA/size126201-processed-gene-0.75-mRNA-1//1//CDS//3329553185//1192//frame0
MAPGSKEYAGQYFAASALAATSCYPLWRSAAIGQSGFAVGTVKLAGVTVPKVLAPYVHGFLPPYKGMGATVFGMTYARAAIFFFSDIGREAMLSAGIAEAYAVVAPPLIVGTIVQVINQPLVRATITLQDPSYNLPNTFSSIKHIYSTHGAKGLWHGTTAGVLKTVPKYCAAIIVKDFMEGFLAQPDPNSPTYEGDRLRRSAVKAVTAGIAGAALTNPLDVIRNEQFKTHLGLTATVKKLWGDMGASFLTRGIGKNMISVALPVGMTLFFTDAFIQLTQDYSHIFPKKEE